MSADFFIKVGDLLPAITVVLKNDDGSPADLSTADSVTFRMSLHGAADSLIDDAAGDIDPDPLTGSVSYPWASGDTDAEGTYDGEFTVHWPSSKPQTFPSKGYIKIQISKRLPLP